MGLREEIFGTAFPCDHGLCAVLGVYKLHLFSVLQVQVVILAVLCAALLLYMYLYFLFILVFSVMYLFCTYTYYSILLLYLCNFMTRSL